MQNENQLDESDEQILHFDGVVQLLEQDSQICQGESCPTQLYEQHDFIEPWKPFEIEVDQVLQIISASLGMVTVVPEVCQWKEGEEVENEPAADVVLYDSLTIPVVFAIWQRDWARKNTY